MTKYKESYLCSTCDGSGDEVCRFCFRKGCAKCKNRGHAKCFECQGKGSLNEFGAPITHAKYDLTISSITCPDCSGSKSQICYSCMQNAQRGCQICEDGFRPCYSCGGIGRTNEFGPRIHRGSESALEWISLASLGFSLAFTFVRFYRIYLNSPGPFTKVDGEMLWRHAEKRGEKISEQLKPEYSRYKWHHQKRSSFQSARVDHWGYDPDSIPRSGAIIDSKYGAVIDKNYIDQVRKYSGHPFYAKDKIILCREDAIIKNNANVPDVKILRVFPSPTNLMKEIYGNSRRQENEIIEVSIKIAPVESTNTKKKIRLK